MQLLLEAAMDDLLEDHLPNEAFEKIADAVHAPRRLAASGYDLDDDARVLSAHAGDKRCGLAAGQIPGGANLPERHFPKSRSRNFGSDDADLVETRTSPDQYRPCGPDDLRPGTRAAGRAGPVPVPG